MAFSWPLPPHFVQVEPFFGPTFAQVGWLPFFGHSTLIMLFLPADFGASLLMAMTCFLWLGVGSMKLVADNVNRNHRATKLGHITRIFVSSPNSSVISPQALDASVRRSSAASASVPRLFLSQNPAPCR